MDQSSASSLQTFTVAVRGSSKSSARSPKQVPSPTVRTRAPSMSTWAVPRAMTKRLLPNSPCLKIWAPRT